MTLRAFGMNCTLTRGPAPSSTQKLLDQVLEAIAAQGAETEQARVVDLDVKPGVSADEGGGDQWPELRRRVLEAQILVLATPIWLGQPSSVAKRVLERMDAFLGEIDDQGRYPTFGRVAVAAVVGNEDGAHHVTAELYQALADVGFTVAAGAAPYWVGEAMGSTDYKDLDDTPKKVADSIRTAASNAVHLARMLQKHPYPAPLA
ncbi:NAD(P)H-dependent oxidoreductase [Luteimonas sp. RD2P54]|uniref:NAD(P)H-dependent oxidoreductase n=1 Tax=Luteimonas endophytica TaxID=3042023 RepID=A0ABT6JF38_9GAMM|nr:NAD(P)H-dependent oxidoreductase [Luteimonas endophytica]MDH5824788.1 NAD(P)H-dependent oxidoreductase [Luteimonas endophytica]